MKIPLIRYQAEDKSYPYELTINPGELLLFDASGEGKSFSLGRFYGMSGRNSAGELHVFGKGYENLQITKPLRHEDYSPLFVKPEDLRFIIKPYLEVGIPPILFRRPVRPGETAEEYQRTALPALSVRKNLGLEGIAGMLNDVASGTAQDITAFVKRKWPVFNNDSLLLWQLEYFEGPFLPLRTQ